MTVTNALEQKPVPVYGSGQNIQDWLYVEDHCRALESVIVKGRAGEIYNIGGGQEITNLELVGTILDLVGKPQNSVVFVPDRPGHDRRYALDASKIRRELGWEKGVSFAEALQRTVE